jgi:hypothetical protein
VSIGVLQGELAAPEDVRVHVSDTHLWYCPRYAFPHHNAPPSVLLRGDLFVSRIRTCSASARHKIPLYGADVNASKATVQLLPDHVLVKIPLRSASKASIHNDR